jgi:hypothetical protein
MSYKMPSEELVKRMQQLTSNLKNTPEDCKDSIYMLKMEASYIMEKLTEEYEAAGLI